MSKFCILIIIILILIIIFLISKFLIINYSIKNITKQLKVKRDNTNNLITTITKNKKINYLISTLNKELDILHTKEVQYDNSNYELYKSITNISHDIRTPLTAIKGYIDLLKKERNITRRKQYISIIDTKTEELISLTEQLFDYSKCLDLQNTLKPENICLNGLLEDIILSYYALLKRKKIEPKIDICSKKIYKTIDKNIITRILENIISNIIKYANKEMSVSLLESGKIVFSNKTNALDSVSVKKIFDRYFTVENGKKSTGIGLAIAKQLVNLNNGKITAKYKDNNLVIEVVFN